VNTAGISIDPRLSILGSAHPKARDAASQEASAHAPKL
jgi:hypothetical protein